MEASQADELLRGWRKLNDHLLRQETSKDVVPLLRQAVSGKYCAQVRERVDQRFNALRSREEKEMLRDCRLPEYLR